MPFQCLLFSWKTTFFTLLPVQNGEKVCLKMLEMLWNEHYSFIRVRKIYLLVHRKEDVKVFLIWFQLTLSNFHSKIHEIWLAEAVAEAALIKNLCYFRSSDYRRFLVSWRFWWNLRPKLHLWEMNEYSRDNHHHCWCWCVCLCWVHFQRKYQILASKYWIGEGVFSFWCNSWHLINIKWNISFEIEIFLVISLCFWNCVENMYHSVKSNTTLRTSRRNMKLIKFIFVKFKMFFVNVRQKFNTYLP